ncbi:hypothetical protein [Elioraea sp.]|uniref:hypothetical protein n=1 Tax=Elioraea sp. TaxID=2185103 RepID=UPI0025BCF709|nr:hypothetical protein [Elioraea sp.]
MRTLARIVASLLLCASLSWAGLAGAARAAEQQALTRTALESLAESADALRRGNTARATELLGQMTGTVNALVATAGTYAETARAASHRCEARSLALIGEIEGAFQRQQAVEAEQQRLAAELSVQNEQAGRDAEQIRALENQMHALAQEVSFRNQCNADLGFYFRHIDRCFGAVAETMFTTRDQQLRNAYDDVNRMRMQRTMQLRQLEAQERDLDDRIAGTRREVAALQSRRAALSQQDEAVRLAITSLSDVTVFWDGARSLLSHRVGDRLDLLNDLLPTLDRTKKRPVFDRADRNEIKSLRDTLLDFARSVDDRNNFLLAPAICQ